MTTVDPIPDGFHSVTPYLVVDGADVVGAVVLGAVEVVLVVSAVVVSSS